MDKNGLRLAPFLLVNLLKELGFNNIHTLVQIESPESLQANIIELYANSEDYQAKTKEEKKSLLGPTFWRDPSRFKFLPGEKDSILAIKSLCEKLQEKQRLV